MSKINNSTSDTRNQPSDAKRFVSVPQQNRRQILALFVKKHIAAIWNTYKAGIKADGSLGSITKAWKADPDKRTFDVVCAVMSYDGPLDFADFGNQDGETFVVRLNQTAINWCSYLKVTLVNEYRASHGQIRKTRATTEAGQSRYAELRKVPTATFIYAEDLGSERVEQIIETESHKLWSEEQEAIMQNELVEYYWDLLVNFRKTLDEDERSVLCYLTFPGSMKARSAFKTDTIKYLGISDRTFDRMINDLRTKAATYGFDARISEGI